MQAITNQRELRAAFWRDHPQVSRRKIPAYSGKGWMYCTDTRCAFVDWLDAMQKNGAISEALANRATLTPSRAVYEYEIHGNYGHGFECECSEDNRRDALQRLKEYRENGPGQYKLVRVRKLESREG